MRKLILILTLSLSFFNNSHSAENLFCIDLDSKHQWDGFYSIYQIFNKGKSDECSASNLGAGLKIKKLVKISVKEHFKSSRKGLMLGTKLPKSEKGSREKPQSILEAVDNRETRNKHDCFRFDCSEASLTHLARIVLHH